MSTTAPPRRPRMDERIHARRRAVAAERTRRRRRITYSLLLACALLAGMVAVARSPLFAITDVRASGVKGRRAAAALEAAAVREGANLLTADLSAAEQRVESLPWVRSAHAARVPPSTVELRVVARVPAAVVRLDGASWIVDDQGVVLRGGGRKGLVKIDAPNSVLPGPGTRASDAAVRNALAVRAALPADLRDRVRRYDAASTGGLRLRLEAQAQRQRSRRRPEANNQTHLVWVRFGLAERVDAKARVITALLDQAQAQARRDGEGDAIDLAELDVRAPANPVLVPAEP